MVLDSSGHQLKPLFSKTPVSMFASQTFLHETYPYSQRIE